jgi:hypothetical protein
MTFRFVERMDEVLKLALLPVSETPADQAETIQPPAILRDERATVD